jgi:uncharacterized membrane protein
MIEHPFEGWLAKAANYSSVLACGVYVGSQPMAVKSYSESFTEQQIKDVLQRLAEIVLGLRVYQLGSSRLRWVFEHGQFHIARRQDGAFAVLAVNQSPDAATAIEELFRSFNAVDCPFPEQPVFRMSEAEGYGAPPGAGGIG